MDQQQPRPAVPPTREPTGEEIESVLTTPEDVASAGRSCMAIVVLGVVILLLLVVWIVYRAAGGP